MKVTYKDKRLEKQCTDERTMNKERGDIAKRLRLRIAALEAAKDFQDLQNIDPLGNWHALKEDRKGQFAGKLSPNMRLIVEERDNTNELVVTVEVIEIVDYH